MSAPLTIGVLLLPPLQLLDLSSIDLLGMLTPSYLQACNLPTPLLALGRPVNIYYISTSGTGSLAEMTSSSSLLVTHSLTSSEVQPCKLDMLMIPGPDPCGTPSQTEQQFIKGHANSAKTDILTICTGIFALAHADVISGKWVTGPRALVSSLKQKFPQAKWTEKRWERDGRIWTSAGITNGHDLVAAWLRENVGTEMADLVCAMADVGGRTQEYMNGRVNENGWWVSLIVRSWWRGKRK